MMRKWPDAPSYGVGAVFAWPAAHTLGRSALLTGLLGLGGGVLLSSGLLALIMSNLTLNIFTTPVPLSLPAAVSAASVAWTLGNRSSPAAGE
jgi:hypothetical protein